MAVPQPPDPRFRAKPKGNSAPVAKVVTGPAASKPAPMAQLVQARPAQAIPQAAAISPKVTPSAPAAGVVTPPSPPELPIVKRRPGIKVLFLAGLGLMLLIYLALNYLGGSSRVTDPEAKAALENLKVRQGDWWSREGLGDKGSSDPEAALRQLRDLQRDWWEYEDLAKKDNRDSSASLDRLHEMQRDWMKSEGLDKGKPGKAPASALAHLDEINRTWWNREGLARATTPAEDFAAIADPNRQVALNDDAEGTKKFRDAGGTEKSENAVEMGLQWLTAQQKPDGRWVGNGGLDNASTALALLPFLARGETHKGAGTMTIYTKKVEGGIKFLILQQKPDGDLRDGGRMYTHALATIALCEDFNMTSDPALRNASQKAINFLINAQDPRGGGWRYGPKEPGDLSVTSWVLQALKSGHMAGLDVPRETWENATRFLKSCSSPAGDKYGYMGQGTVDHSAPTMTAAGILCRQYLQGAQDLKSGDLAKGVEHLVASPPVSNRKNIYYYYYATQSLFNIGDERWRKWNPQMRDMLVSTQNQGPDVSLKGSWDPAGDNWGQRGGRIMQTSLSLLILEVYYRHLPLNRPDLGDVAKNLEEKGGKK